MSTVIELEPGVLCEACAHCGEQCPPSPNDAYCWECAKLPHIQERIDRAYRTAKEKSEQQAGHADADRFIAVQTAYEAAMDDLPF